MFTRIDHVALHVRELAVSVNFYETNFGFKKYFEHFVAPGHEIAYLKLGDTVLELSQKPNDSITGFHFCLETGNFDEAVTTLQDRGLEVIQAPHSTPAREPREQGWRRVVFRGPDGELIELRG
jgi:lactoylglutathione lyase